MNRTNRQRRAKSKNWPKISLAFLLAIGLSTVLQPLAHADAKKKLQAEIPKLDGESKTTTLKGGVTELQLESDLRKLGITLENHKPGLLPATVSNVFADSLAAFGNIEKGDVILKLEADKNASYVTIQRNGKSYRAVLSASQPNFFPMSSTPTNGILPTGGLIANNWNPSRQGSCRCSVPPTGPQELANGTVRLQLRSGAIGGNPVTVNMAGATSIYVSKKMSTPLDLASPIQTGDPQQSFCDGGFIPQGKVWTITEIKYSAIVKGDFNGHGEFKLMAGGKEIYNTGQIYPLRPADGSRNSSLPPIAGDWHGQIEIRSGEEDSVCATVANSCQCEVILIGDLF